MDWLDGSPDYPRPVSIHFDLTLRCNARCLPCKQWSWPRQAEMPPERLKALFGIFKRWGVQTITLGGGNPLLSENISLALECARNAGIKVGIITEGTELPIEVVRSIAENASWIRFSLDGPTPEIHDRIRGAPGLFDQVMDNIAQLQAANSSLPIGINCVLQRQNYLRIGEMIELAERKGVAKLLFKIPHGEDPRRQFLLNENEWARLIQLANTLLPKGPASEKNNLRQLLATITNTVRLQDCASGRPVKQFYLDQQAGCFVPLFFLACDSLGYLYPCDYLQADTRAWNHYQDMRSSYCLGNALDDGDQVFERLSSLMRSRIHDLPKNGFDECGCCTRFYLLNSALSRFAKSPDGPDDRIEGIEAGSFQSEGQFL